MPDYTCQFTVCKHTLLYCTPFEYYVHISIASHELLRNILLDIHGYPLLTNHFSTSAQDSGVHNAQIKQIWGREAGADPGF